VRFWDSSALVPLVCRDAHSARCRSWLRLDPVTIVWALAATEIASALARKQREGALKREVFTRAKQRLRRLESSWSEVIQYDAVFARARRLLETHPLRTADALHLGAALVAFEEQTAGVEFVTFDSRLAEAAEKEGFQILSA
jgi:predicted nucleic acid-binding protein